MQCARRKQLSAGMCDKDGSTLGFHLDLSCRHGLLELCGHLMALVPFGLHMMEPECSSYHKFTNSRNTGRTTACPDGNASYGPTALGNKFAAVVAFCLALGFLRQLCSLVETKEGSRLYQISCLRPLIELLVEAKALVQTITYGCAFATASKTPRKAYRLLGSHFSASLRRKCMCPPERHTQLMRRNSRGGVCPTVTKKKNVKSNSRSTTMKESQVYSWGFANAVVCEWLGEHGHQLQGWESSTVEIEDEENLFDDSDIEEKQDSSDERVGSQGVGQGASANADAGVGGQIGEVASSSWMSVGDAGDTGDMSNADEMRASKRWMHIENSAGEQCDGAESDLGKADEVSASQRWMHVGDE